MRQLFFLFFTLTLPLLSSAQSAGQKRSTELQLNAGYAADNAQAIGFHRSPDESFAPHATFGLLRNRGRLQYGAKLHAGINTGHQWFLAPGITANYRFSGRRGYGYTGATTGYVLLGFRRPAHRPFDASLLAHGGYAGVQAGYVRNLTGRIALNAELAIQYTRQWLWYEERVIDQNYWGGPAVWPGESVMYDALSMPVTLGIRYRLGFGK